MSGVTGDYKIESRRNFENIVVKYSKLLKDFPGFEALAVSGSYNSNLEKETFGDIDLIITIKEFLYKDKKEIKLKLIEYLTSQSEEVIVPFVSLKYAGRRYYNSVELVSISYKAPDLNIPSCQIDNIIAVGEEEAIFKKNFLDMPAEKQGLVLGLVKTILLEETAANVFHRLGIYAPTSLTDIQEYEFNLSSTELQIRRVTYVSKNSFKQASREIIWTSKDWNKLIILLKDYSLNYDFEELLDRVEYRLTKERSLNRMVGVFKSMISIKSGEVGTEKAVTKQNAIDEVESRFKIQDCDADEKLEEVRELFKDFKFFVSVEKMDEWTILLRFKTNHKLFSAIGKVQKNGRIAGMKYMSSTYVDGTSIEISVPKLKKKFRLGDKVKLFRDGEPYYTDNKWEIVVGRYPSPYGHNHFKVREINNRKKDGNKFEKSVASYLLEKDENA